MRVQRFTARANDSQAAHRATRVGELERKMEREILTLRETAEYLCCSRMTIYRLLRQGDIPAFRIGIARGAWRFMREPLDNWMESRTVSPPSGGRKRVSTHGSSERS